MLVVDPWHWLQPDGSLAEEPRLRTRTIRVARLIEAGGPLPKLTAREVLVECEKRPGGRPCRALLVVTKLEDDTILAACPECEVEDTHISNWQTTPWANGLTPSWGLGGEPEDEGDGSDSVH